MKKILSLILAFCMLLSAVSVFAAQDVPMESTGVSGIEVGRHTESDVINVEGQIAYGNLVPGEKVTVLLTGADNTVLYVEELEPDFVGKYGVKFYCEGAEGATIKIKYNKEDVSDTLTIAEINGRSTLMEAEIVLLNERGSLFSQNEREDFPIHDKFKTKKLKLPKTYQSMYKDEFSLEGDKAAQAYIKVKNAYGLEEAYTPIVAFYGENNKLLKTEIYDIVEVNFEDKAKTIYTDVIDLPEGTTRVKAFAWDKDKLIPFGDSNEGELDPIQVILVGSSAAQTWMGTNTGAYPGEGYGLLFGDYFNTDVATYFNKAVSGASAPSFFLGKLGNWNSLETGKPDGVIDIIKAGNEQGKKSYVIVELGGNDLKGKYYPGWTDEDSNAGDYNETTYKAYLMRMYNEVAELGGQVLFSNSSGPANGNPYENDGTTVRKAGMYGQIEVTTEGKFIIHPNTSRQQASEWRKDLAELTGTPYFDAVPAIYENYNKVLQEKFNNNLDDLRGYYLRDTRYMIIPESEGGWGLAPEDAVIDSGNTGTDADTFYQDFSHTNLRGADANAYYLYKSIMESDSELKFYMR